MDSHGYGILRWDTGEDIVSGIYLWPPCYMSRVFSITGEDRVLTFATWITISGIFDDVEIIESCNYYGLNTSLAYGNTLFSAAGIFAGVVIPDEDILMGCVSMFSCIEGLGWITWRSTQLSG